MNRLVRLLLLPAILLPGAAAAQAQVVRIYNWSDYIDPAILDAFTAKTGITGVCDVYDDNSILEAKLLAGNTGYDLVVPTANYLARQLQTSLYDELDKTKIPNLKYLDPKLMAKAADYDLGNAHAFIYMWGTTAFA